MITKIKIGNINGIVYATAAGWFCIFSEKGEKERALKIMADLEELIALHSKKSEAAGGHQLETS